LAIVPVIEPIVTELLKNSTEQPKVEPGVEVGSKA